MFAVGVSILRDPMRWLWLDNAFDYVYLVILSLVAGGHRNHHGIQRRHRPHRVRSRRRGGFLLRCIFSRSKKESALKPYTHHRQFKQVSLPE